jgi:hypothetical protein
MYVVGSTGDAVYEYSLSIAWELDSTITLLNTLLIGATNTLNLPLTLTLPTGIDFNASGTKMYITDSTSDVVARFDLATPWDTTTTTFFDNVYVGFQELTPTGIFLQEDQSKAYIVGSSADTVFQYNTDVPSLELASAGITTRSSVIINNEARLNNRLYVTNDAHFSSNANVKGTLTVNSATTVAGTLSATGAVTASTTTGAINFGTSQTTGTLILGGTSQTGAITLGIATTSQTVGIATGVSGVGTTKTINLGTGGASGSRTLITVGSATAGAASTVTIPPPTNLLIGTATTTGTASQRLQVSGGAYVSGNLGIGNTNPGATLNVVPTATSIAGLFSGTTSSDMVRITQLGSGNALVVEDSANPDSSPFVVNASGNIGIGTNNPTVQLQLSPTASISNVGSGITLAGTVGSALTVAQFLYYNTNASYLRIKATRNSNGSDWLSASTKLVNVTDVTEQGYIEYNPNGSLYGMAFGSGATELVRLTSTGNFGVGSTNPNVKFEVFGGSARFAQSGQGDVTISHSSLVSSIRGASTVQLALGANNTDVIRINNSGSVGIGTTNPSSTLDVRATGATIRVQNPAVTNYSVLLDANTGGPKISFGQNGDNVFIDFGAYTGINNLDTKNRDLRIFSTAAPNAFTLQQSTGNIGINTTNPTSQLHVVGVVTATSYNGSGTNLTGIVTSIVAGSNISVSESTGQVTINSTASGGGVALDILEVMLFA